MTPVLALSTAVSWLTLAGLIAMVVGPIGAAWAREYVRAQQDRDLDDRIARRHRR